MIFEWNEEKNRWTLKERGFDFTFAVQVFEDTRRLERIDRRRDYGEERRQTVGQIEGETYFHSFHHTGPGGSYHIGEKSA